MERASRESVEAAAEEWGKGVVACRSYGHQWKPLSVHRAGSAFIITQRCPSCRAERECEMDSRGYASPWKYRYPEGYLMAGLGRVDTHGRAALRLKSLESLVIEELPDDS